MAKKDLRYLVREGEAVSASGASVRWQVWVEDCCGPMNMDCTIFATGEIHYNGRTTVVIEAMTTIDGTAEHVREHAMTVAALL